MRLFGTGWRWLRSLGRRRELDSGLDEEIRFHLEQQTAKNLCVGMTPDEARRRALVTFGALERAKEGARDQFRVALLEDSLRDLRYGWRALRRAPVFTIVATLTVALGIGAATSVFSVVNAVLIRPLPYPKPEALVAVWHRAPGFGMSDAPLSATHYFTYLEHNRTFSSFGVWASNNASVTGEGDPEELRVLQVSFGALDAIGVPPALGRWFSREDDLPAATDSVILAHDYWLRRFSGDPSVIGRLLTVNARPRIVIGVMPSGFRFVTDMPELILPLKFDRSGLFLGSFNYFGVARLRPRVSVEEANADLSRLIPTWLNGWPSPPGYAKRVFEEARFAPALRPLKEEVVGDIGNVLSLLMGTVFIVLLIACANVANLQLVRAEGRQQEFGVRVALGAGRGRLARALLLESLLLGLFGGVAGAGLTVAAVSLLVFLAPATLPRLEEITVDTTALGFAFVAATFSGLLFGLIPVLKHAAPQVAGGLRGGGPTDSRERHRVRNALVVAQVALALLLLVASGLMTRSFMRLRAVDPGFVADDVQLMRISIPEGTVDTAEHVVHMQSEIRERLAAIPGVTAAAFASAAPMEGFGGADAVYAEDRPSADKPPPIRRFRFVSPSHFQTVGTRLLAGRDFSWTDVYQRRTVAVISENMAREMWREPATALGKRIRENPSSPWREIVGVVANVYEDGVHVQPPAIVYWPVLLEKFWGDEVFVDPSVTFELRSPRAGTEGCSGMFSRPSGGSTRVCQSQKFARWTISIGAHSRGRPSHS